MVLWPVTKHEADFFSDPTDPSSTTLDNEILQSKKRTIGPPSSLYVYSFTCVLGIHILWKGRQGRFVFSPIVFMKLV